MNKIRKLLIVLLITLPGLPTQAEQSGNYWIVQRGDTLYAISRALFPANTSMQYKLRKQIIQLNQEVFKKGAGSLYLGAKLLLPPFVKYQANKNEINTPKSVVVVPKVKKPISRNTLEKNEWLIKSGDTLYSIARAFYPKSTRQQYKLRKDIKQLNPDIFRAGANKMKVGLILLMPDYLVKKEKAKLILPLITPKQPSPVISPTVEAKPIQSKATERIEVEPEQEVDSVSEVIDDRVINYQDQDTAYSSQFSTAFGFSTGGDVAVSAQGGRDVTYGSGFNFRFSYDGLWRNKYGYRVSLGYQIDKVVADNSDSGQVEQMSLQTLYLYNISNSLFGVGVASHSNISRTIVSSSVKEVVDFEPVIGLMIMYEYKKLFGNNIMGISYTQLETEEVISKAGLDMTRTELYYRWAF